MSLLGNYQQRGTFSRKGFVSLEESCHQRGTFSRRGFVSLFLQDPFHLLDDFLLLATRLLQTPHLVHLLLQSLQQLLLTGVGMGHAQVLFLFVVFLHSKLNRFNAFLVETFALPVQFASKNILKARGYIKPSKDFTL